MKYKLELSIVTYGCHSDSNDVHVVYESEDIEMLRDLMEEIKMDLEEQLG